jgi:adenosylcobinamide-GDP ribazoletransferase
VIGGMGKWSLVPGTFIVLIALAGASSPRAWIAGGAAVCVTAPFGFFCRRRIGGITGDTLGANLQLCECAALLAFLWVGWPQ